MPKRRIPQSQRPKQAPHVSPPPPPFIRAPESIQPFLSSLSPSHIYITSLDQHDTAFKRRIFAVPLLLNILLTVGILYRLQFAIPTYINLVIATLGYESSLKVDVSNLDTRTKLGLGGERALMFLGDFLLLRFVGMWPWGFFLGWRGEASPVGWRRWVGFRGCEIVVRRSRRIWDRDMFRTGERDEERDRDKKEEMEEGNEGVKSTFLLEGKQGMVWRERVEPAVERRLLQGKTAYALMDKSWELDFSGMIKAHDMVDKDEIGIEPFKTAVWGCSVFGGGVGVEVWREHESGEVYEGTIKLLGIKNGLTRMGKENLFFRVVEVVQSETSQPGPFTKEKQKKAVRSIREEFDRQNVDFDAFWDGVGGVESMPGLETTG